MSAMTSSAPSVTLIVAITGWVVFLPVGPWTVWTVANPFPTVPSHFPIHREFGGIYQNFSCVPFAHSQNTQQVSRDKRQLLLYIKIILKPNCVITRNTRQVQ